MNISAYELRQAAGLRDKITKLEKKLAKIFGASGAPAHDGAVKKKRRKMSASARAKIAKAQKARWAKYRAGKK